ncbi:MAG: folate family ECF transporter S component [Bilifractor sp.]|jgi:ECF transporter S component (folate family)
MFGIKKQTDKTVQNAAADPSRGTGTDNIFAESLGELSGARSVAFCGVMAALAVVLNYAASIEIGQYVRIGFSMLPNIIVDDFFGPAIGGIFGGALDIIKYLLKPTGPFFPGFTVSAILGGIIYGLFFYKKKITVVRVLAANAVVKVCVNILLNSVWLHILYGKGFIALLPARVLSNAIMLPIDTAIYYFMLNSVNRGVLPRFRAERNRAAA